MDRAFASSRHAKEEFLRRAGYVNKKTLGVEGNKTLRTSLLDARANGSVPHRYVLNSIEHLTNSVAAPCPEALLQDQDLAPAPEVDSQSRNARLGDRFHLLQYGHGVRLGSLIGCRHRAVQRRNVN